MITYSSAWDTSILFQSKFDSISLPQWTNSKN